MRLQLAAYALLLSIAPADSSFRSGNEMYANCSADASTPAKTLSLGYVMGAADAVETAVACPNPRVGVGQMHDVFCAYLQKHPETRDKSGGYLAALAFAEAWPCPKE